MLFVDAFALECRDQLCQRTLALGDAAATQRIEAVRSHHGNSAGTRFDHRQDHADQAETLAIFRAEDARNAVTVQLGYLVRYDNAAAAKHLNVGSAALAQQIDHVLEIFDMPTLVAGNSDPLRVLLQCGGDDVVHRAVVSEVDYLRAVRHQDAAHDVDRGVMAVEQRGGGDEAHLDHGLRGDERVGDGEVGHGNVFFGGMGTAECRYRKIAGRAPRPESADSLQALAMRPAGIVGV